MLVIHNPVAGRRRTALMWQVISLLTAQGIKIEVAKTERAGHATQLARQAAQAGVEVVVAAGGDGTIAEIAKGLLGAPTKLGIIPLGTANVLAKEYGLPAAPQAIAEVLYHQHYRALWPGLVQLPDQQHIFVQMLGLGFDGAVVHALQPGLKRAIGKGAYVWHSVCEAMTYKFPPIQLRIDGKAYQAASVIVSKGRLYGGAHMLAPQAKPDRPGFQVVLFEKPGAWAALMSGAALPLGLLHRCPQVRIISARHIEFPVSDKQIFAQTDGDMLHGMPQHIQDAAYPLSLLAGF